MEAGSERSEHQGPVTYSIPAWRNDKRGMGLERATRKSFLFRQSAQGGNPERLLLDSRRPDLTGEQRDELFVFLDESVSGGLRFAIFGRLRGFELLKPEFPLPVRGF